MVENVISFDDLSKTAQTMNSRDFTNLIFQEPSITAVSESDKTSVLDVVLKIEKSNLIYGEITVFKDDGKKYCAITFNSSKGIFTYKSKFNLQTSEAIKATVLRMLAPIFLSGLGDKIIIGNNKIVNPQQTFDDLYDLFGMTHCFIGNQDYYVSILQNALHNSSVADRIKRTPENNEKLYSLLFEQ